MIGSFIRFLNLQASETQKSTSCFDAIGFDVVRIDIIKIDTFGFGISQGSWGNFNRGKSGHGQD